MSSRTPIHVVLVRPIYSRNVGSVSRAMGNMGAQKLILIDPKCKIDFEARQGAAGAQTHLMELTQYASWDEFYKNEPEGLRIAFCGRDKKESDIIDFGSRLAQLHSDTNNHSKHHYFIFGPEDHGLSNEDIHFAHFVCALPTHGSFVSLNLSHAVLLALHMARQEYAQNNSPDPERPEPFFFPEETLQNWLTVLGFELGERRTDVYKVLKRILLRNIATPKELRILEAVIFQTLRKLQK